MEKLNIGCGYDKKEGFMNIDIAGGVNPDKVVNIEKGLPFKENTFIQEMRLKKSGPSIGNLFCLK